LPAYEAPSERILAAMSIAPVTIMGTFNRQFEQRFCFIDVGISQSSIVLG